MSVCCATLLSSELVGPACMQAQSSNPRGRAYRPDTKGSGKKGILSDGIPVYYALAPRARALSNDARLTSVCLSDHPGWCTLSQSPEPPKQVTQRQYRNPF